MQALPQKELVEELKTQWRRLWRERIDDKVRAEGIANNDYSKLFVEKGTVIFATRNFTLPSFRDILEQNDIENVSRFILPIPQVGGWRKFMKTTIPRQKPFKGTRRTLQYLDVGKERQQLKKGGRGWLHL